jgi:hypothetical protein
MLQGIGLSLSSNSTDHSPMSTSQAAIPKKRKVRSLYDGSNGVSYGRQCDDLQVSVVILRCELRW